jgi:DNA-binding NarL/FixJ family response regulator
MTTSSAPGPLRVVLVDDHEMVIAGLKAMLTPFRGRVRVVGEAIGADQAIGVVTGLAPDLVLASTAAWPPASAATSVSPSR